MKPEYLSHQVHGVSFTSRQPSEFLKAMLLDLGWTPETAVDYLVAEFARIRGKNFSSDDAVMAVSIFMTLDAGIPDPRDVDLPQLTSDILTLFYESM